MTVSHPPPEAMCGATWLTLNVVGAVCHGPAALVNVNDEIPLMGVLRGPLFGLADEELYRIGRAGWRRVFEERFAGVRQLAGFVAPDQLIARALDACDWWATLGDRQRSNVEKLLAWIRREHHNNPRTLAELLEALESLREMQAAGPRT
mgnify:CR=1 FL=1